MLDNLRSRENSLTQRGVLSTRVMLLYDGYIPYSYPYILLQNNSCGLSFDGFERYVLF